MSDFTRAYSRTMGHEGGWVNNPADTGGETYKGISRNNWPGWGGWKYIDGAKAQMTRQPDFGTSAYYAWVKYLNKSLAALNALQALVAEFYRANFWKRLTEINDQRIAETIFDMDVNSGCMGSKLMQRAAGVRDDGQIGDKSIAAINALDPVQLLYAFNARAHDYYEGIIVRKPSQAQFRHSWMARLKNYDETPYSEATA